MTDLRALAKRLNDASLSRIANLREPSPGRGWSLVGMFALGALIGAAGVYAVTQRTRIARLAELAARATMSRRGDSEDLDGIDLDNPISVTTHHSNHRRKAAAEVSSK